ncbi:MobH family relaxase [Salinisphaera orenii]|uniref:MobH family relaxase n=1 Tax=Salinisphaera orenii TaxID=856731 RepID=UPI000DBE86FB
MIVSRFKKWLRPSEDGGTADGTGRNRLKVLLSSELLAPFEGELAAIRARAGVPAEHWRSLYQTIFDNYAALVQRLPASESHHHAGVGGLLQHGIEVARHTLDLKQGIILPRGEAPEVQSRVQDLWTYACVTAALLHDLGKPVTDQCIMLYDGPGGSHSAWSAVHGPMPVGATYGIEFNPKRVYRHHERIPPLLAHHLIPIQGLQWIASDQSALHNWLAAIQGDLSDADAIGEIVGKADGLSVARNLIGSKNVQLPTAKAKPLVERLLTGLRYLLDNGELPMNRRGAAAYLDGDTLWLVSKTTLDKLRTHLIEEGQPGIPTRNDRLMDELQQHGLLVANDRDRAVWMCQITIGDWQHQLTCLRMDANRIWSDPTRRPDSMDGHVEPIETETDDADSASAATARTVDAETKPQTTAPAERPTSDSGSETEGSDHNSVDGLPLPFDISTQPAAVDEAATADEPGPTDESSAGTAKPSPVKKKPNGEHHADGQIESMDAESDAGERFMAWLKQSIEDDTVPINTVQARIHILPEGLALVSPRIFRDFDSANWSHAQKRFQKLKLHRKTPKDENIWTCQATGSRKQSLLKVILIPDPVATLGINLPEPNPAIILLDATSTPSVRIDSTVRKGCG